ncbi:MAG: SDR family NAD(P)-dependent oxidoreductase [Thermoplasmatales archaeon]
MSDWGPFSITGKRTIITGGAMGIGRGIAKKFLEGGAVVTIVDKAEEELNKTFTDLRKYGSVYPIVADLADEKSYEQVVRDAVKFMGGIDVLVNNAGIYPMVPMLEMREDRFDLVYKVNLKALAFLSREAAKQMIAQGKGGRIINIASIDSLHPSSVGLAAYDASKGGVLMFTKNFALEVARFKINVNAIAPGGIATEGSSLPSMSPDQAKKMMESFIKMIPLGRMGEPEDVANAAVFLASPASSYMTGSLVVVDGGRLLS